MPAGVRIVAPEGLPFRLMQLGIPNEQTSHESRVAAPPASVPTFVELGFDVAVETDAGRAAGFLDTDYELAGATVVGSLSDARPIHLLVRISPPTNTDRALMARGGVIVGLIDPAANRDLVTGWGDDGITTISMEMLPRSTLAQAMDALSSQATAAGYAAVLLGVTTLPKFMPMLVTAAGTIPPSNVLILGVGVAGLQAIATAKRLGAVVYAYDIRPETKEQVESLGGRFVEAPTLKMDEGGYARAVDEETQAAQKEALASAVAAADLIITTAQVPGRRAPRLIDREMVEAMKPGSVIIDMAAASGGNVEGSSPDETVVVHDVTILGPTDLASRVATDSSRMFGRNVLELVKRMVVDGELIVDPEDPVVGPAIVAPIPAPQESEATE
ncbi:MAG: Re/Si-specific NAD(P)(+) transhydrogenase subunit alpha [Acidimicrobiia bacterium]|nr:MAG: Re/Si-specific NAD(P)(+) transhydrogenase subunit alpha [Acidimicrobiia bacterium]